MSDNVDVTIVSDTQIHHNVGYAKEERATAVGIALELVKSASAGRGQISLRANLKSLSEYADQIQEAL